MLLIATVQGLDQGQETYARFELSTGGSVVGEFSGSLRPTAGDSSVLVNVTAGLTYSLRARTGNESGADTGPFSAFSAPVTFTTAANQPPATPTVTAPNGGETVNTTYAIQWTGGADPEGQTVAYEIDLTTNGGSTWTNLTTSASGTSYVHDFTNVVETTTARVRIRARDPQGLVSAYDESNANFTILHNQAPLAPILNAPAAGSSQDLAAGFTFTWTHQDSDGLAPSGYAFRRKIGAGAYEYWNAGTALFQSALVWNASTSSALAFASGKWTNGTTYQWSVATRDNAPLTGPFATDATVTATTTPTVTVTAPSGSVTNTSRPVVRWTLSQPEGQPQQTWQARVFTAAQAAGLTQSTYGTAAATADSTEITAAATRDWQVPADLLNGTSYVVAVRSKAGGLYTPWGTSSFSLSLTPPAVPVLTATSETSAQGPRVVLSATVALATPYTAANTTVKVERSLDGGLTWQVVRGATSLSLTNQPATVLDYEVPRGRQALFRALSVGDV